MASSSLFVTGALWIGQPTLDRRREFNASAQRSQQPMTRIVLASTNEGKAKELLRFFDLPELELITMRQVLPSSFEVEETGTTFEANAWLKAEAVCAATGLPTLADDSGLEVDALGGRPGVRSARYAGDGATDGENNGRLLEELAKIPPKERTGRFICVLVFAVPGESRPRRLASATGTLEGVLLAAARGNGGFGYDPLFEALERPGWTTAELPPEEKDAISHRGRAARALVPQLRGWLHCSEG